MAEVVYEEEWLLSNIYDSFALSPQPSDKFAFSCTDQSADLNE